MPDKLGLDSITPASGNSELSLPTPKPMRLTQMIRAAWRRVRIGKIGLFVASLFLFVLAIMFMKDGARGLVPLVRDIFPVTNMANSLGFGWLFAYVIMSGSPVAAAARTFFEAGAVDKLDTFAMITGSRLGASFIVLFIGFIYVLRGRDRATSLSMGLLPLSVTGSTYLVGLAIGAVLLQTGALDQVQLPSGMLLTSAMDLIFTPIVYALAGFLPGWSLFIVGLGIIMLSFNLFDRCLPQMSVKESQVGHLSRLVYRRWVMFVLGAAITLISMSVSVSLSILVPLSNRGFIRRENVIPYIMGANITTFIDTLLASVLLDNQMAFTIVLVQMVSITLVSSIILFTAYRRFERGMLDFVSWVTVDNRNLALFMITIFLVPLILMLA
jgi:sodium-dependent phosphate cotransporter